MEPYVAPLPITPLAASATWTGGKQDRLASTMIRRVRGEIWAPQAGTLYLDHWDKEDGSDVAAVKSWSVSAGVTMPTEWVDMTKRFFRWRFVNGATAQNGIVAFEEKLGRPVMDVSVSNGNVTTAAEGTTGAAAPAKAMQFAGSDGTNLKVPLVATPSDGQAGNNLLMTAARNQKYNGTTWDNERNNTEGSLLGSSARTALATSPNITNYNGDGVSVFINVTAKTGATTLSVSLRLVDPVSGTSKTVATVSGIPAAVGSAYVVEFSPGIVAADFIASSTYGKAVRVTRVFNVIVQPSDADSVTYSAGYCLHV